MFVAQLDQRRASRNAPREFYQRAATRNRRIDESIKAQVDVHQLTFARAMSTGPSRL